MMKYNVRYVRELLPEKESRFALELDSTDAVLEDGVRGVAVGEQMLRLFLSQLVTPRCVVTREDERKRLFQALCAGWHLHAVIKMKESGNFH